jgi:site-specific DNA-methyltransferase (adenine-specific)
MTKKLLIPQGTYFSSKSKDFFLYKDDCIKLLSEFPENCVDMIFADPPYFLSNGGISCHAGKMVSVHKGDWDQSRGLDKDFAFIKQWLSACQRVLKDNGTIWVSGTNHVIYTVGYAMHELGFKMLNDIVWFKRNAPPNLSCRYFTHSTETVIWAAKNKKSRHYFNYKLMKEINMGKQMRNLWEIMPPKKEEKKYGRHPTQKPLALLNRIILASTKKGQLVLDPFNGSGTTGIAAACLNRKYIGMDLEKKYLDLTIKRYKDLSSQCQII